MAWEMFKKGDLDTFALTLPEYWHDKAKGEIFDKGYVHKGWFYNDAPQPDFGIWLNQDVEIFKDRNVRYAFAHGMNIDKVLKEVLRGDYLRLHTGTYGHGEYTNHSIRAREFSIPKVEALMTQSGWKRGSDGIWAKDGKRFSVRVTYGRPDHSDRLVVVQEEAKKAGIELNLQLLDSNASFKTMQEKNHEVAWSAWSPQPLPEYRSLYHSSNAHKPQNNNFSNTDNKDIDAAIEGFIRGTTVEEKAKFAHRLQELVHEEGAYIPTFLAPYFREAYWRWWRLPTPPSTRLSSALIEPLDSSSGGLFWFDEDLHKETMEARKSGKAFAPVTIIDETFRPDPKKEAR
jgi:microcin C transport system substrate-binding protein